MNRLFVYVDGSDLEEVEHELLRRFERFIETWGVEGVRLVNDKFERTADMGQAILADWNLGLNVRTERLPPDRINMLVQFLAATSGETGREFVIGSWDESRQISEDLCFIGHSPKQRAVEFLIERLK